MASKKTLTAANLEALGAPRLAQLLLEIAQGDTATQRRLRLALAIHDAPGRVAAEVRKRLAQVARASAFLDDGRKIRTLLIDLDTQRRAIVEQVAKIDAGDALELMWRFLELAGSVHERTGDRNRELEDIFGAACCNLGPLAEAAKPDPLTLADCVFDALEDNGYGQYEGLIAILAPALGSKGLDHLKASFVQLSRVPADRPPTGRPAIFALRVGGPVAIYANEIDAGRRASRVRLALRQIADAQGDVDGFIEQHSEAARKRSAIAAGIARRLLAAGRADEALRIVDAAEHARPDPLELGWLDFDWEDARIDVLDALGRGEDAQAQRWSCFEDALSARHLRAWLDRLPDFEDDAGERRALDHAERHANLPEALSFLVSWRALDRAAHLVTARAKELEGDRYEVLTPVAQALAEKHPLAATLPLRAMVEFALVKARAGRYRHAARHLAECATLAPSIPAFGPLETHEAWATRLKSQHRHKWGFWSLMT
jgi:hypothetical protein